VTCEPSRSNGYKWALMEFKRVTTNARRMGGIPCLRGLRIRVATIVSPVGRRMEHLEVINPLAISRRSSPSWLTAC
jgi:uncharacterized protein (DUF433 family)